LPTREHHGIAWLRGLSHKKGLRIEEINKQLGTTTKLLMRPMLKVVEEGKIKKTGEKRATTYFPA